VAAIAAAALLATYAGYWVSITATAREANISLVTPIALQHIVDQGFLIVSHLWGRSARIAAVQVAYFEIVMPIAQVLVLLWVLVKPKTMRDTQTH